VARLSDEFIKAVRAAPLRVEDLCAEGFKATEGTTGGSGNWYTTFCQYMPRRRGHHRAGEPARKVPRARWSKQRLRILAMAKILGVPKSRVFVEDD
jgi:hypothetical protein